MSKILVSYFSASGITKNAAKLLAAAANADIYEIAPELPYTSKDLDWRDKSSRSSIEMNNPNSRPKISKNLDTIDNYDVIFLGFPIWWYREPSIIDTFLESYDFTGKKIIIFATSGGSKFGNTVQGLKKFVPSAEISEGKILNGKISEADLKSWIKELNL